MQLSPLALDPNVLLQALWATGLEELVGGLAGSDPPVEMVLAVVECLALCGAGEDPATEMSAAAAVAAAAAAAAATAAAAAAAATAAAATAAAVTGSNNNKQQQQAAKAAAKAATDAKPVAGFETFLWMFAKQLCIDCALQQQ